jgi:hypothetical protein
VTAPATIVYRYTFTFQDGSSQQFTVTLDTNTLSLLLEPPQPPPDWTRLEFHQCPNCPLDPATHPHCPVALNLTSVVSAFKDRTSVEPVIVTVESRNRAYTRETSLQNGVAPLLGLHMTASGCPILDRLRPLVETHLPFMSRHETMYRIISMHVMAQFFAQRRGEPVDFDLTRLRQVMDEIHEVNVAFCRRLREITSRDASVNAVVILSTLGDFPSQRVTQTDLARLERLLQDYYGRSPQAPPGRLENS